MIEMKNWATQAVKKLEEGRKEIPVFDATAAAKKLRDSKLTQRQKEEVVAQSRVSIVAVKACEMISRLCRLDEDFARAVTEGGSFDECLQKALEGVLYEISDVDLVRKCAEFYFPGSKVSMEMTIDTTTAAAPAEPDNSGVVMQFNLDDFLL